MRVVRGFGRWQPLAACLAVGAIAFFGLSLEGAKAGKEPGSQDRALRTDTSAPAVSSLEGESVRAPVAKEVSPYSVKDPSAIEQNPFGTDTGISLRRRHVATADLPHAPPVRVNPFTDEASLMRARGELVGPWRPNVSAVAAGGCPGNSCTFNMDCDDCNDCTTDRCVILPGQQPCAGTCTNIAIANGDGADSCSDGLLCNGIETCQGGSCEAPGAGTGTSADPELQMPCTKVCAGGTNHAKRCVVDGDCPGGGTCVAAACNEELNRCDALCSGSYCNQLSTNAGKVCTIPGDCPGPAGSACVTGAAYCDNGAFCDGAETCGSNGICDSPGNVCGQGADCSELTCPQALAKGCFSSVDCLNGGACTDQNRAGCFRGRCCTKGTGCVTNADCDPDGPSGGGEGLIAGGTCTAGQCSNIAAGDQACSSAKMDHCVGPNKAWYPLGSGGRPVLGQGVCPIIDPVPGIGNVTYQCPKYSSGIAPRPTEYVVNVGPFSDSVCEGFFEVGDDYSIANGSHLALETFVFAGGALNAAIGGRYAFEFYDSLGNLVEDVFFASGTGLAVRTILIDPPIVIPPNGRVIARVANAFDPDARLFWAATSGPAWMGGNDVNVSFRNGSSGDFIGECTGGSRDGLFCNRANLNADCIGGGVCDQVDDVLAFELSGDKVPAPNGACCDSSGNCTQETKWVCSANPANSFIDGPCSQCSDDSLVAAQSCTVNADCKFCIAGSNLGNPCNVNGDCPGSSCIGGLNDGDPCTIPANCPGGICTAGSCPGSCVPQCATGACCNIGTGVCSEGSTAGTCATGTCNGAKKCDGGTNPGVLCPIGNECLGGGVCRFTCVGSQNAGDTCVAAADCSNFLGYGVSCVPNCCDQPTFKGADECANAMPNVADLTSVSTAYLTMTGNNSAATGPDSCLDSNFDVNNGGLRPYEIDPGWWEHIKLQGYSCFYMRLDMCCSDPLHAPAWNIMWDRCPCQAAGYKQWIPEEDPEQPDEHAFSRGAPYCDPGDDNLWTKFGPLPAGDYYYPIYSAQAGAHGAYQLHATIKRCPEAACCYLRCETGGVPTACTQDSDCPAGSSNCVGGECMCELDAQCGGGQTCEPVCDERNILDCEDANGTFLGLPFVDPAVGFCVAGTCDTGSCCRPGGLCDDVQVDLVTPISKDDCDAIVGGKYHGGTLCFGGTCADGTRAGLSCNDDSLCPGGVLGCVGSATQLAQRTCPICEINNDAHCQLDPGEWQVIYISDASVGVGDPLQPLGSRIADDFVADESGAINTVCVIGSYVGTPTDCTGVAIDKWTVNVYNDDPVSQALPGSLKGTSQTTITAKGVEYTSFGRQFTRHMISLNTPITGLVNGTKYWIEIYNDTLTPQGADDNCNFYWSNADQGQGNNYAMQDLSGTYGPEDAVAPPQGAPDMAWCINLRNHAPPEPLRACCSCIGSGQCDAPSGDPCCHDTSFYECAIERKQQWIFGQQQCAGFTCPVVNSPVHDECSGAITLATGVNVVNNDCATDTPAPLDTLTCEGNPTPFKSDVWYKWINTCPGAVQIDMCDYTNGQDTVMAIYGNNTGTCPCPVVQNDQIGDCNDDGCFWGGTGPSLVIPDAETANGDCLLIRLAGFVDDDGGFFRNGKLEIACQGNPAPLPLTKGNDDLCAGGTNSGNACAVNSDCPGGFCRNKNRFITAIAPATATSHGLKITITNLDANSVATPASYNGTDRWAGAPAIGVNDGISPPFNASQLQCAFASLDWSAVGQVHFYGQTVVPASTYSAASCNPQANCSSPLTLGTARFGDVVAPVNTVNFQDVNSIVAKFQGTPAGPSKTRTKLTNSLVNPANPINFQEVSACVSAFQSKAFKTVVTTPPPTCP